LSILFTFIYRQVFSRGARAGGSLNQVQVLSKDRRIKYQVFSRRARLFNPKSGSNGTKPSKKNFAKSLKKKWLKCTKSDRGNDLVKGLNAPSRMETDFSIFSSKETAEFPNLSCSENG
jgi:hypothetical protein